MDMGTGRKRPNSNPRARAKKHNPPCTQIFRFIFVLGGFGTWDCSHPFKILSRKPQPPDTSLALMSLQHRLNLPESFGPGFMHNSDQVQQTFSPTEKIFGSLHRTSWKFNACEHQHYAHLGVIYIQTLHQLPH